MPRSKTTQAAIHRLYAVMATAAAKQAMNRVKYKESHDADIWLDKTIEWLDQSSADAVKWHFAHPRVDV